MKQSNWTIMGKGGVGKSFVTWLLAQYFIEQKRDTYFADTDPTNATFSRFPAINAQHINITDDEMNIDQSLFDKLVNEIAAHSGYSVIDTGAPSFLSMMNYLTQNGTFDALIEDGHQVIVHTPLVGGPAKPDTLQGIYGILENTNANIVVWQNDYFGPVMKDGMTFTDSALYSKFGSRILGVVHLPKREETTFGRDIHGLIERRLLLNACDEPDFPFAQKSRIKNFRKDVFSQLDAIRI
ncbi:hypothetical protein [Massilia sp. LjRoot122]|uniref:nucleotide-binding protein n=1 Tax=Massilia sp. LjRoot122 TaxID=3342257 RepID=UPI003ECC757A